MSAPEVYLIQFYRQEPGDVGIPDIPVPSNRNYEETAKKALLGYLNNQNIAPQQRPHHVRVVSKHEFETLVTLMATGQTTVERV